MYMFKAPILSLMTVKWESSFFTVNLTDRFHIKKKKQPFYRIIIMLIIKLVMRFLEVDTFFYAFFLRRNQYILHILFYRY